MTINILINGAFGRMGQLTVKAISADSRFTLVGQTGREYDLKQAIKDSHAQVIIDFTTPQSVFHNTQTIIESGVHPVIGTTGLTLDQVTVLQAMCDKQQLGGLIVPNFSLGAVLMMKFAQHIIQHLPNVEIIEMHHDGKKDSPSGTAIRTAELLSHACQMVNLNSPQQSLETLPHARGANHRGISIHSLRLPGILAQQQIIFGNTGETLTLSHQCIDRACFMPGVLLACEKVISLNKLIYGLEHIL